MEQENNEFDQFLRSDDLEFSTENGLLNNSMIEIESTDEGKIELDGKKYTKVSTRLQVLRKNLGFNVRIKTDLLHIDEKLVVAKAEISIFRDGQWFEVATGHAEEKRESSEINKFSAVENAETSAIGRALAALGLSGDEYASIEEIIFAKKRKESVEGVSQINKNNESQSSKEKASPSLTNFLLKLLRETGTETDKFLSHYKVKSITDLTTSQAEDGMHLLKRKKKSNLQQKAIDQAKKDQQQEALSVLQENENNEQKVKSFKKISVDDETEEIVEKNLPKVSDNSKSDDIIMDDDFDKNSKNQNDDVEGLKKSDDKTTTEIKETEIKSEPPVESEKEEIDDGKKEELIASEKKDEVVSDSPKEEKSKTPAKRGRKPSVKKDAEEKPKKTQTKKKSKKESDNTIEERKPRENDLDNDDDIVI